MPCVRFIVFSIYNKLLVKLFPQSIFRNTLNADPNVD